VIQCPVALEFFCSAFLVQLDFFLFVWIITFDVYCF